jgi:hypothetical protein
VRNQVAILIRYDDLVIENGYRADMIVADREIVELKAVQAILPVLPPAWRVPIGLSVKFSRRAHEGGNCEDAEWLLSLRVHREPIVPFVVNFVLRRNCTMRG